VVGLLYGILPSKVKNAASDITTAVIFGNYRQVTIIVTQNYFALCSL
jgi:hypothetical protein